LGSRAPKGRVSWPGLGVTGPGVIHPSFPLRGRWERPESSRDGAPSSPVTEDADRDETRPTQSIKQATAHSLRPRSSPVPSSFQSLARSHSDTPGLERVQIGNPSPGLAPARLSSKCDFPRPRFDLLPPPHLFELRGLCGTRLCLIMSLHQGLIERE
jgi:hypothetical protein